MANFNRIILVGRLTADPQMRYTVEGIPTTRFSLAVDRDRKTDETHQVDYINIVAWRRLAEICAEFLKKGRLVLVEGSIQVRSYEGETGRKWVTEVVARNMCMLERKPGAKVEAPMPPPEEELSLPEEEISDVQ